MANEFADLGVEVNSVAPGEIETAMLSPDTEVLIPRIPLNRLGQPNDIASTIYFCVLRTAPTLRAQRFLLRVGSIYFEGIRRC
ncbi:MAG: hypothetical protein CM15mP14_3080 [Rhodospirillaceae bacterium]|nr:MAG: hypothetical protein CM15mP14_3080 [Rhodospirillaceae bacterium]